MVKSLVSKVSDRFAKMSPTAATAATFMVLHEGVGLRFRTRKNGQFVLVSRKSSTPMPASVALAIVAGDVLVTTVTQYVNDQSRNYTTGKVNGGNVRNLPAKYRFTYSAALLRDARPEVIANAAAIQKAVSSFYAN